MTTDDFRPTEQELESMLREIQPTPRQDFYRRAADQPWRAAGPPARPRAIRHWSMGLAVAVALVALLALPPIRTFATNILGQLGLVTFTNEPSIPEKLVAGTPVPQAEAIAVVEVPSAAANQLTPAQLSAQIGAPVYAPPAMPAGWSLGYRVKADMADGGKGALSAFTLPDQSSLMLLQYPTRTVPMTSGVGAATVQQVTVGGNEGIWMEGIAITHDTLANTLTRGNALSWEAGGFTFSLMHYTWGLAEQKAFAEALTPQQ
ncbi:MAG TPA: hypothetical protein VGE07_29110 [Herpetosiphonaceae bacterium]